MVVKAYSFTSRFTPAYAGKMFSGTITKAGAEVHPRIRGEDPVDLMLPLTVTGSPPHTRGRSWKRFADMRETRFTPAYAGKIMTGSPR